MNRKTILSSLLTIVLCLGLIAGTTYALFTSEDKIDISVTSAKVSLEASVSNLATSSMGVAQENNVFENGGGATFEGETLTISLMAPGDKVTFNITGTNTSNVTTQYRYIVKCTEGTELIRALTITIGDKTFNDFVSYTSAWATLAAETAFAPIPVVIEMPENVGNRFQGLETKIQILVEAVQGNAEVTGEEAVEILPDEWDGTADTAWYDATQTEFVLKNAEELAGLSSLVADGISFANTTIKLDRDLDLMDLNFIPVGNWDNVFEGDFDGQGHIIYNLCINDLALEGAGLIGVAQNAVIKGICVENVNIDAYSMVAAIVGSPYTGCTVSDCHVTGDVNIVAEYAYAGGIVGYGYTNIDNCSVIADGTGTITAKERNAVGGISAWLLEGNFSLTNCTVKNLNMTGWANIGGLTGFVHYNNLIDGCTVENVTLTKTRVDGQPSIGIAAGGFSYHANNAITISNNSFKNISLNGTAINASSASYIFGSEYGGAGYNNFVLENNAEENIQSNLVYTTASYAAFDEGYGKDGTHNLSTDIVATDKIYFGSNTTNEINLNGNNVEATGGYLFSTQGENCVLTITGDGNVTTDAGYAGFANKNSTLNIAGGNFELGETNNKGHFYAQNASTIVITDGTFISEDANTPIVYCINGYVEIKGGFFQNTANPNAALLSMGNNLNYINNQKITLSGGTFVNWNPMSSAFAQAWTNPDVPALIVLADGYKMVSETQANGDVWYMVVPE